MHLTFNLGIVFGDQKALLENRKLRKQDELPT